MFYYGHKLKRKFLHTFHMIAHEHFKFHDILNY